MQERLRVIAQAAEVGRTRTVVDAVTTDPSDNRILECAVDGQADLIVSNGHHQLEPGRYGKIPILTGPDFRRTLGLR